MPALAIRAAVCREPLRHAVHYGMRASVFLRRVGIFGRAASLDVAVLRTVDVIAAIAKPPIHYMKLRLFSGFGRGFENFIEARKTEMFLLVLAVDLAHLVHGALLVGPIAALGEQRNVARDFLRLRIVVEGHAVHPDRRAAVRTADEHLEHVPVRDGVVRRIAAFFTGLHADDLALAVDFHFELGVERR